MKSVLLKFSIVLAIAASVGAFYYFDLRQMLSLESLQEQQEAYQRYYAEHKAETMGLFLLAYVVVTGASMPGATLLTLAAGLLFGVVLGTVLVSIASTAGATLAFLSSRFLLRDFVQSRFPLRLRAVNAGMDRSGLFYLFSLRLVPILPFFVINLTMGLTRIPVWQYMVVSQIGMLPATVVYVNAGTQLSQLESLSGILSLDLLASFLALALLPFLSRLTLRLVKSRTRWWQGRD